MASAENDNSTQTQEERWRAWAVLAQKGDKNAYSLLLREISSYIKNTLIGGLANPDWADDITQEVLISVHKSLKTYSSKRPFKPWLMAIVGFRRTDFLRKHYNSRQDKQTDLEDAGFQKTHVTNPEFAGEFKDIEAILKKLPKKQRKVFELMKIKGYTAQEVAKEMGMSESAVKVSAHRAQKKIQDLH